MQAFIPDAKDALEEVDVLKKDTLTEMEKQLGRKEAASPGYGLLRLLCMDITSSVQHYGNFLAEDTMPAACFALLLHCFAIASMYCMLQT